MDSNNKKAIKSGTWYTISNFIVRSIGFITTPIFTRLLTQEEFGSFNNYTSWTGILSIIFTLNLESTLISAYYDYKKKLDNYIFSVLVLSSCSILVWTIFINLFLDKISDFLEINPFYINCIMIYLLFYPAVNLFQMRERYYFRYKSTIIISMLLAIGTSLISVLFVLGMKEKLTGRILGYILPTILLGLPLYFFFWIKGQKINILYWKYALKLCLPYIPHLLSLYMLNSMDRVMITKICGAKENGLYSLAYNCGALVTILSTSLNSAFAPWLGEKLSLKDYGSIRKVSKSYISIFAFFAVGIMLFSPEVLLILGGDSYLEAEYVLAPVAMGCVCQFMYTLFVNVEQFSKNTVGMAFSSASAAILNYCLNLYFISQIGYLAAAYTTLISYLWLLFVHMFLVYKLGLKSVYNYKFIFNITIIMLMITIGINFLYFHFRLRILCIIAYFFLFLFIAWRERKMILKILRSFKK